jgi:hypothetical protein
MNSLLVQLTPGAVALLSLFLFSCSSDHPAVAQTTTTSQQYTTTTHTGK